MIAKSLKWGSVPAAVVGAAVALTSCGQKAPVELPEVPAVVEQVKETLPEVVTAPVVDPAPAPVTPPKRAARAPAKKQGRLPEYLSYQEPVPQKKIIPWLTPGAPEMPWE